MLYWFWNSPEVKAAIYAEAADRPAGTDDDYVVWERSYMVKTAASLGTDVVSAPLVDRLLRSESANETMPLEVVGESAVPLILREFDAQSGASALSALYIIDHMVMYNTADPSAPAIRAALADTTNKDKTREVAAKMLGRFWYSREVPLALADGFSRDPSAAVKTACISSLGRVVSAGGRRTDWHTDHTVVQALSLAISSPDESIRAEAKDAIESIREAAWQDGHGRLEWATQLLSGKPVTRSRK